MSRDTASETFTNMEEVRPGIGREAGLGHVCDEPTGKYSRRVSEAVSLLIPSKPLHLPVN